MAATIFIDESGDLGWTLDRPYGHGGSSRYLTIAAVVVREDEHKHRPSRLVRDMYKFHGWSAANEKKWTRMSRAERLDFATKAAKLAAAQPAIKLFAMTVRKANVQEHLRADPNLLYNYMLKLMLLDEMAAHDEVVLKPDPRTIKVQSGNSQHEYLQTVLWYERGARTRLHSEPEGSEKQLGIQFADMLAGVVQSNFELNQQPPWRAMKDSIAWNSLFFNGA
jgi:hypothetical protein